MSNDTENQPQSNAIENQPAPESVEETPPATIEEPPAPEVAPETEAAQQADLSQAADPHAPVDAPNGESTLLRQAVDSPIQILSVAVYRTPDGFLSLNRGDVPEVEFDNASDLQNLLFDYIKGRLGGYRRT